MFWTFDPFHGTRIFWQNMSDGLVTKRVLCFHVGFPNVLWWILVIPLVTNRTQLDPGGVTSRIQIPNPTTYSFLRPRIGCPDLGTIIVVVWYQPLCVIPLSVIPLHG